MDIEEINLDDLVSRFFEKAPAREAVQFLQRTRKLTPLAGIKPILNRRLLNACEQLSRFYGLVEIGFITRFISEMQVPSPLRDKWLIDLSDPRFAAYCEKRGLLLPTLLRCRLSEQMSLKEVRSESLIPLYLQFLEVTSLLDNNEVNAFLPLLKACETKPRVNTCIRMLASPAMTTLAFLKPEFLRTRNDHFVLGLGRFLDFCRELDVLLHQSADLPLFRSAMWHYHSSTLTDWQVDLGEILLSSLRIVTVSIPPNDVPEEALSRELRNIENTRQVLERVTSSRYRDALESAANVPRRAVSLTLAERAAIPSPSDRSLITLEGVTKVFLTDDVETRALEEIHLEIKKGQYISIAGPSGSGKSTLLSILGLLDSPTRGNYWLNDEHVANLTVSERTRIRNREIGFIFQAFNLIGDLTVYENVELPLTYRGMHSTERKQRVQTALERVGMAHRLRHYPSQLSGGQQQRVAVARALVGDPLILMADEPTGNLDSKNGEAVMELLRDLHRNGATICMVTHDQRYANFAERTIHLFDGRIAEEPYEATVSV